MTKEKMNFDPGFSRFSVVFPREIPAILDEIAKLKQPHQKKFEFQKLEAKISPIVRTCASVYTGCMLWGGYLACKYKNDPREITGNTLKEMPELPDYSAEMDFILETVEKIDKTSKYYLKRPFKINGEILDYFRAYKEFALINNGFAMLDSTKDIKLPEKFLYLNEYDDENLEELKNSIYRIIESGKIEDILGLVTG